MLTGKFEIYIVNKCLSNTQHVSVNKKNIMNDKNINGQVSNRKYEWVLGLKYVNTVNCSF